MTIPSSLRLEGFPSAAALLCRNGMDRRVKPGDDGEGGAVERNPWMAGTRPAMTVREVADHA
ncbi:MAG: hypothetical protein J0H63_15025 [Rhizobiales bacterium]|nr:hypothetical protein [Hyphomicrobiales bacterium]MBN9011356.1 hypothetical protein [Hyphomicrobiales bacterium]